MKQKRKILTLAAITALFGAGGCDLNNNVCVYGPPPDDYDLGTRPYISTAESIETSMTDPVTAESTETAETAETTETFDPAENFANPVYGPPVFMETSEESAEASVTSDATETAEQEE